MTRQPVAPWRLPAGTWDRWRQPSSTLCSSTFSSVLSTFFCCVRRGMTLTRRPFVVYASTVAMSSSVLSRLTAARRHWASTTALASVGLLLMSVFNRRRFSASLRASRQVHCLVSSSSCSTAQDRPPSPPPFCRTVRRFGSIFDLRRPTCARAHSWSVHCLVRRAVGV